ncbi:hypothetical protein BDY19DRAFT_995496 [Irpex rosettiformis]|uniref:Uncharacterized protein n=1 Tax=Irpex rosettiformis TaxID=378272 RepID=A0ACB8TXD9_9APHY|nr:hypothetical protein BDY19DRAFT_995496 [Irpex rosettiformis]
MHLQPIFALFSLLFLVVATRIGSRDDAFACPTPIILATTNITLLDTTIQFDSLTCDPSVLRVHTNTIQGSNTLAQPFGQCGGQGFTGPTVCVSGFFCEAFNPFFSQCMPLPTTTAKPTTTAIPTTTVTKTIPAPTPTPTNNVCNQLCSNTCGSLGSLPPISEDCQTIFDSITILGGSVAPTFEVPPNSIQQLTFGTCRVFFENLSAGQSLTYCWSALANTSSAAGTQCFPPTQPVMTLGLCTSASGLWAVG